MSIWFSEFTLLLVMKNIQLFLQFHYLHRFFCSFFFGAVYLCCFLHPMVSSIWILPQFLVLISTLWQPASSVFLNFDKGISKSWCWIFPLLHDMLHVIICTLKDGLEWSSENHSTEEMGEGVSLCLSFIIFYDSQNSFTTFTKNLALSMCMMPATFILTPLPPSGTPREIYFPFKIAILALPLPPPSFLVVGETGRGGNSGLKIYMNCNGYHVILKDWFDI